MHSNNSDCILSAFHIFGPIYLLLGGGGGGACPPNVPTKIKNDVGYKNYAMYMYERRSERSE